MATDPATVTFLLDQLGARGAAYSAKRMFGEYCIYRDGVPVALVCDHVLYVKPTGPGREALAPLGAPELAPPYRGAKPHLRIAPDLWEDGDALRHVLEATASALPAPKPRAPRGGARKSR